MTRCYECSAFVNSQLVAVYIPPDEDYGYTLCVSCQPLYPRDRQYRPRRLPNLSCIPLREGDLP